MKKTALVTGGNSGIGYATAGLLKAKGYEVCISGRDKERLTQASAVLGVEAVVADMGDAEKIRELALHFQDSGLDVLVNNASMAEFIPIGRYSPMNIDQHFDVNVRGPLLLIQELLPALEKRQGAVTTISSIIVSRGSPGIAIYAATKGAVDAFTRSLAIELAPRGIRVNAVAPGPIETPIFTKVGLGPDRIRALLEKHLTQAPMRRRGEPREVAEVVIAQLESSYVTGSIWHVDGGTGA